jgi:hypothetical protein
MLHFETTRGRQKRKETLENCRGGEQGKRGIDFSRDRKCIGDGHQPAGQNKKVATGGEKRPPRTQNMTPNP